MCVVSICMILPRVLGSCLVSVLVNVNRCFSNELVPCSLHLKLEGGVGDGTVVVAQ
jgi:hypothetical protein